LPLAVNLDDFLAILPDPGVAQRVFASANRNNFPAGAEHGAALDDIELAQFRASSRTRLV
jgi:hypothetical protein